MEKQYQYDFAWGNPYFLLDILSAMYKPKSELCKVSDMVYSPDPGFKELVDLTKKVIKDTTGLEYKYVVITNGATHALNAILQVHSRGENAIKTVVTNKFGYPFYSDMIRHKGLKRVEDLLYDGSEPFIRIVDSPSNPQGMQSRIGDVSRDIWDAVYHNGIYTNDLVTYPNHKYFVGSYSKLLGLTGARVGFIATNNPFSYKLVQDECLKEIATVSVPSQRLIIDILKSIDLQKFISLGKDYLEYNRNQFRRIEYLFDGQKVQETGMFFCAYANDRVLEVFEKCGINYIDLGDNYIRLSLGQSAKITKAGIEAILKEEEKK